MDPERSKLSNAVAICHTKRPFDLHTLYHQLGDVPRGPYDIESDAFLKAQHKKRLNEKKQAKKHSVLACCFWDLQFRSRLARVSQSLDTPAALMDLRGSKGRFVTSTFMNTGQGFQLSPVPSSPAVQILS